MNGIISLFATVGPQLWQYYTKNYGLNTSTGSALGGFLGAFVAILSSSQGQVDGLINTMQNAGEKGMIAAAIVTGLRTAVYFYAAAKGK